MNPTREEVDRILAQYDAQFAPVHQYSAEELACILGEEAPEMQPRVLLMAPRPVPVLRSIALYLVGIAAILAACLLLRWLRGCV
jgi:hypothetical protein